MGPFRKVLLAIDNAPIVPQRALEGEPGLDLLHIYHYTPILDGGRDLQPD